MNKIHSLIAALCTKSTLCTMLCAFLMLPLSLAAQTITFESADYKAVGVYDMWEASPFRTGALVGNAAVVGNPFKNEINNSERVLGFQRSRFGSNMYGARIDLKQTFELTPDAQYVHVLLHKPGTSRVMLMGLGKRQDRAGQSPEVEQFWERCMPTIEVQDNEWFDAVFAIKGNGGIDIYSLVVVVDATSTHALTQDFVAYIDDIEVNASAKSRTATGGDYPICFAKDQNYTRSDRKLNSVTLQVPSSGSNAFSSSNNQCYVVFDTPVVKAKPGERVTPSVNYTGSWMHSYIYIDKNHDGQFSSDVAANGGADANSDLVSFSYYQGKNSNGANCSNSNVIDPIAFTIPSTMDYGYYRMRWKIDWNSNEPEGHDGSDGSNYILDNGGAIWDHLLLLHKDKVNVYRSGGLNGDIVYTDGREFVSESVTFNTDYKIKLRPAPGFLINYLIVRHGYNLNGESTVHSVQQWREERVESTSFATDGTFTLPAAWLDGDVMLTPEFLEDPTSVKAVTKAPSAAAVYDLSGRQLPHTPQHGIYIEEGVKKIAR